MPPRKSKAAVEDPINLTSEEKKAAKTSTFFAYSGRAEWGWINKGLSPEAKVAQLRGIKFVEFKSKEHPNRHNYYPDDAHKATQALRDVAAWLGYPDWLAYNKACETKEKEVRKRLREAK